VRGFLCRVRAANLTLWPTKCALGYGQVTFLGHLVRRKAIKPHQGTVDKILKAPHPVTKKHLRSFMGLMGFYRKFIPNFTAVAVPLTDLTRKGAANHLKWAQAQTNVFNALRQFVANPQIFLPPDFRKQFIIQTDASNEGIGAMLLQEEEGVKHSIAFASKKLLPRERNHSIIERECLAIWWGIQKFQTYLYGQKFILETDHQPLVYLGKAQFQNTHLMRWALALQPYNFTLHAVKDSENVGADYLSHHSID